MYIKMKDLPVPQFAKPLSRRVYGVLWAPFDVCWDLWTSYRSFLFRGFGLAAFGGVAIAAFMYFMGALTATVAFGMVVATIIAGAGLTALLTLLSALG